MLIQRVFDSLGAGGIPLALLTSLVGFALVGVSNYRRSLAVCRAVLYKGSVSPAS